MNCLSWKHLATFSPSDKFILNIWNTIRLKVIRKNYLRSSQTWPAVFFRNKLPDGRWDAWLAVRLSLNNQTAIFTDFINACIKVYISVMISSLCLSVRYQSEPRWDRLRGDLQSISFCFQRKSLLKRDNILPSSATTTTSSPSLLFFQPQCRWESFTRGKKSSPEFFLFWHKHLQYFHDLNVCTPVQMLFAPLFLEDVIHFSTWNLSSNSCIWVRDKKPVLPSMLLQLLTL